jgi:hypothetical protein
MRLVTTLAISTKRLFCNEIVLIPFKFAQAGERTLIFQLLYQQI